MFGTLIESHPAPQRRRGSAALAAVVHLAAIAGTVAMTTRRPAGTPYPDLRPRRDTVIYVRQRPERPTIESTRESAGGFVPRRPVCDCTLPPLPPIPVPGPVDLDRLAPDRNRATPVEAIGGTGGPLVTNPFAPSGGGAGDLRGVYAAAQVERAASVLVAPRPAYPEMLRAAGIEGRVVVRFVVDSAGRVEPQSIEVVEASHALFERAVREALPRFRFAPAEVGGRRVRQLVELPIAFTLDR